jgi:ABC-type dipeptide/oligopeptide/nickel transport system ATPase component
MKDGRAPGTPSSLLTPLLEIEGLTICFPDDQGKRLIPVVREAGFTVGRDEIVGLVGESGSGKTQTAMSILRLTRPPGRVTSGRIALDGQNVLDMPERQLQHVRGSHAAMIFQSPRTSLNPLMKIGDQVSRIYVRRQNLSRRDAQVAAREMLGRVGIAGPDRVAKSYPHQLSGGMAQRVMIAMMLACGPSLLIADEPTTGLDVTIQAQIFELIQEVQAERQMSVLLITHDLGVVAEVCQRVVVMQLGRVVEIAPVDALFASSLHPYSQRLLGSIIRPDQAPEEALLQRSAHVEAVTLGDLPYQAVSVDAWPALQVTRPEMLEVNPGHWVLAHPLVDAAHVVEVA